MRPSLRTVLGGLAALPLCLAVARAAPLPDPLTLPQALALAERDHPDLRLAAAEVTAARAATEQADADMGLTASVSAVGRWVDPSPVAPDRSHNDSLLTLTVRKPLYDFGRTAANRAAAQAVTVGSRLHYADTRARHRLRIMARYFDVLLADLQFSVDDEAMAVAYVQYDRVRDRNKLHQVSDVALLAAESAYQDTRSRRYASQARQRTTRARLAEALDRPDDLPDDLVAPRLASTTRKPPAVADLTREALAHNAALQALREDVAAARQQLAAARAGGRPVLSAEFEAGDYNRDFGSRDRLRGGLVLDMPLSTGGRVAAAMTAAQAALERAQARLDRAALDVREGVLEAVEDIGVLQAQRQRAKVLGDYRDLYLDRSRALYDLEVRADLGDAMVRYSEARLLRAKTDYNLALAWARLAVLTGNPAYDPLATPGARSTEEPRS